MNITISYQALYEKVSRSLSIIAKRSVDDKGVLLFKDITLSTREQEIMTDYFKQAVLDIVAAAAAFIAENSDNTITFVLDLPENHRSSLDSFIQKSCEEYCVSYALYSWLFITAPRIAPRYLDDCKRQLSVIIRLVHEKEPPAEDSDIMSTTTSVTSNT